MANIGDSAHIPDGLVPNDADWATKVGYVLREESAALQPRFILLHILSSLIPHYVGSRIRTHMLRLAGVMIGDGSVIMGMPRMHGSGTIHRRIRIGRNAVINIGCFFDLNAQIEIGNHVALGHEVMILTSSHHIGGAEHRAGPLYTAPVKICDGAWIGSRSVILPGITIGEGSVVGAGAIVTKDVPPHALVGGVPARTIRTVE
jgi:maltose O-acetyltransferase